MTALPRGLTVRATPGSTATSAPCGGPVWTRWPVWTRPVAAPARGRWSPPRRPPRRATGPGPGSRRLQAAHRARSRALLRRGAAPGGRLVGGRGRLEECDRLGMHVANVEALRRAIALLDVRPAVRAHRRLPGRRPRGARARGVKGDRVAACIAAASVIAKVTRDRHHDRPAQGVPGLRLRDPQGLHHRHAHRGARGARSVPGAPAPVRQRAACRGRVGDRPGRGRRGQ